MRSLLAALAILGIAGAASAATIRVPKDYATIQEAVSAAADGDTITVSKGVYFENVVVGRGNLKLVGKKAVLDGTVGSVNGDCLTVNGEGLLVQGFEFRNGQRHVVAAAPDLHLEKCTFQDSEGDSVSGLSDRAVVSKCRSRGAGGAAFSLEGASIQALKNTIQQSGGPGLAVVGPDARIEKNTVLGVGLGDGIRIAGGNAGVRKNRVENAEAGGIAIDGNGAELESNTVSGAGTSFGIRVAGTAAYVHRNKLTAVAGAIRVVGDSAAIFGNRVSDSRGHTAIEVRADGADLAGNVVSGTVGGTSEPSHGILITNMTVAGGGYVEGNRVEDAAGSGIYMPGVYMMTVRNNLVLRSGTGDDAGFYVSGDVNYIHDNKADQCDNTGFYLGGDANILERCTAKTCSANGFRIDGVQNKVTASSAKDCGDGLDNGGTGTLVESCSFTANRLDIGNRVSAGATITITGTKYKTGGALSEPEVD